MRDPLQTLTDTVNRLQRALQRPSAIYRPRLFIDRGQWCALYGTDVQSGVAGYGETPAEAMGEFDKAWCTELAEPQRQSGFAPPRSLVDAERDRLARQLTKF